MAFTDIEAIKGYLKKYDKELITQALNGNTLAQSLTVKRNLRTKWAFPKIVVDGGIRPHDTNIVNAKGGRTLTERTMEPNIGMKIISYIEQEVRETFMSEMFGVNEKMPMAKFFAQAELKKLNQEVNDNFYMAEKKTYAAFNPATAYAVGARFLFNEIVYQNISIGATTAGETPVSHAAKFQDVDAVAILDGPNKRIVTAVASEGLAYAQTGAFSETDGYEYIKEMWDVLPEAHKNLGMTAKVSFDVAQDIVERINSRFGSGMGIGNADIEEGKPFVLKNTGGRLKIQPVTWMKDSRRIIMAPAGNMTLGYDLESDTNSFGKIVENLHGFTTIAKWIMDFNFSDLETLYVNDQL